MIRKLKVEQIRCGYKMASVIQTFSKEHKLVNLLFGFYLPIYRKPHAISPRGQQRFEMDGRTDTSLAFLNNNLLCRLHNSPLIAQYDLCGTIEGYFFKIFLFIAFGPF